MISTMNINLSWCSILSQAIRFVCCSTRRRGSVECKVQSGCCARRPYLQLKAALTKVSGLSSTSCGHEKTLEDLDRMKRPLILSHLVTAVQWHERRMRECLVVSEWALGGSAGAESLDRHTWVPPIQPPIPL